jgi:hypothetical protein
VIGTAWTSHTGSIQDLVVEAADRGSLYFIR